jgi:hypothetical protein
MLYYITGKFEEFQDKLRHHKVSVGHYEFYLGSTLRFAYRSPSLHETFQGQQVEGATPQKGKKIREFSEDWKKGYES